MRFGDHWRVLLSHLILFGFVYPDKRQNVPAWVIDELLRRLSVSRPNSTTTSAMARCSRASSTFTISNASIRDGRAEPVGPMTEEQIGIWTAAITGTE